MMECQLNHCMQECLARGIKDIIVVMDDLLEEHLIADCEDRLSWVNWMPDIESHDEQIDMPSASMADAILIKVQCIT